MMLMIQRIPMAGSVVGSAISMISRMIRHCCSAICPRGLGWGIRRIRGEISWVRIWYDIRNGPILFNGFARKDGTEGKSVLNGLRVGSENTAGRFIVFQCCDLNFNVLYCSTMPQVCKKTSFVCLWDRYYQ